MQVIGVQLVMNLCACLGDKAGTKVMDFWVFNGLEIGMFLWVLQVTKVRL